LSVFMLKGNLSFLDDYLIESLNSVRVFSMHLITNKFMYIKQ